MKSALVARLIDNNCWYNELSTVLLALRAVSRNYSVVSCAEYVYGQTLRLPGDFYNISNNQSVVEESFLLQLETTLHNLKPVAHSM